MKPNWIDAPSWAKWTAMDPNGSWWWYENRPRYNAKNGCWEETSLTGRILNCSESHVRAEETLEERP